MQREREQPDLGREILRYDENKAENERGMIEKQNKRWKRKRDYVNDINFFTQIGLRKKRRVSIQQE